MYMYPDLMFLSLLFYPQARSAEPTSTVSFLTMASRDRPKPVATQFINPLVKVPLVFCDICGQSFTSRGNMNRHRKNIHLKDHNYHCHVCRKGFMDKTNLWLHEQQCSADNNQFIISEKSHINLTVLRMYMYIYTLSG